jgi:hypothetical protein
VDLSLFDLPKLMKGRETEGAQLRKERGRQSEGKKREGREGEEEERGRKGKKEGGGAEESSIVLSIRP